MLTLRPLVASVLLAALIAPAALAQKPQIRTGIQIQARPHMQVQTGQIRVNALPAVSRSVLRQVQTESVLPERATRPVARLDNAMRTAILLQDTDAAEEPTPPPVLTELELSAQRPFSTVGRVNFLGASVVQTTIRTYPNGNSVGNYVFFQAPSESHSPRLELEMDVESGRRYLLDFRLSVAPSGDTMRITGSGVNTLHPLAAGAQHLLTVVEASWTGTITLQLSAENDRFYFDGLEVSRVE